MEMNIALILIETQEVLLPTGIKSYASLGIPFDVKRALLIDHLESFGYQVYFETL